MTDSDKDLTQRLRQYLNSKYEVTTCYNGLRDEAADRIEELVEINKELTLQLLATSGQAADALDKLAKAVEALRKIGKTYSADGFHLVHSDMQIINMVYIALAELEVK